MKIALSTSVIQRGKTGVAQYVLALTRALKQHASAAEFHLLVLEEDVPLFDFARERMKIVPVPERPLMVSLNELRFSVPDMTTLPKPSPSGI